MANLGPEIKDTHATSFAEWWQGGGWKYFLLHLRQTEQIADADLPLDELAKVAEGKLLDSTDAAIWVRRRQLDG